MTLPKENLRASELVSGIGTVFLLWLPPVREFLESSLVLHMLVQLPLLVYAGWVTGKSFSAELTRHWNSNGVPGILIALFGALFWMIPRWLDAALSTVEWEVLKFITLPLCIGLPLGSSWPVLTGLLRGFVWANAISMLGIVGWLYVVAPMRVCNNYLVQDQEVMGFATWGVAIAIALYWTLKAFFGNWEKTSPL